MIPLPFQHTVGRSPSAPPGQRIGSTPILFSCAASLTCRVSWKSSCLSTASLHLKVASPVELPWLPLFQLCFDSQVELLKRGFGSWSPRESRSPPETGWHSPLFSSGCGVVTGNTWKINSKIWVCVGGEHWKKGEIQYPGPWNKTKLSVLDDLMTLFTLFCKSQWSLDVCYPGLGLQFFSVGLIPGWDTCRTKGNTKNISEENFEKNILYNLQMLTLYFLH